MNTWWTSWPNEANRKERFILRPPAHHIRDTEHGTESPAYDCDQPDAVAPAQLDDDGTDEEADTPGCHHHPARLAEARPRELRQHRDVQHPAWIQTVSGRLVISINWYFSHRYRRDSVARSVSHQSPLIALLLSLVTVWSQGRSRYCNTPRCIFWWDGICLKF